MKKITAIILLSATFLLNSCISVDTDKGKNFPSQTQETVVLCGDTITLKNLDFVITDEVTTAAETEPITEYFEPEPEPITEYFEPEPATEPVSEVNVPSSGTVTSNGHTVTVVDGVTYIDGLLVVNKTYALPETYAPGGLTDETYAAFVRMQSDAAAVGIDLFVKSGYRSYWDQSYIYSSYAASDGYAEADKYSARAGHSEHQSGMALDVNSLYLSFGETPEGIWLRDNCHLYGFIIRYPSGKENITGYIYEPWHIRYVGKDIAAKIKDSGLCLEEYFGITSRYE